MAATGQLPSSFRDPSGFVFLKDNIYYRHIHNSYKSNYEILIKSGCYSELIDKSLIISHEEINENLTGHPDWFLTLKPEQLKYTSQPCEWSFDMLKDAALLTLQILKTSINKGLIIKDASLYNIQLHNGKMVFIDSLSFEKYDEALPWIAYRQFCESFLGPLLIANYSKQPMNNLLLAWPDGIPIEIIKSLLPAKSKLSLHVFLHIHLHAKFSSSKQNGTTEANKRPFTKQKLLRLIESLETLLKRLNIAEKKTNWSNYYREAGERGNYLTAKQRIIEAWLKQINEIKNVADLGANDGLFSLLTATRGLYTIAADADPICINRLYHKIKDNKIDNIYPLVVDLSNPTPSTGLLNEERNAFLHRRQFDLVLCLAVVHHLAIAKNIPLNKVAEMLNRLTTDYLLIEFIPKEDEKVKFLIRDRKDIFNNYSEQEFEKSFGNFFVIHKKEIIDGSKRTLYLMKKITSPKSL